MAGKIKLFESVQKHNRSMGVYLHSNNDNFERSLNVKNIIFVSVFIQMIFCMVAYVIYEAKTVFEYGGCFFGEATAVTTVSYYLIQVWQIRNIMQLIEKFEDMIEESEKKNCSKPKRIVNI